MGEREPEPVRPDEQLLPRLEAARGAERALQAQGRRHPAAEQPVGLHGVGDLHAPAERLGVVEGHLVRRPHRPTSAAGTSRRHARASAGRARTARTGRPRRRRARAEASAGAGGGRAEPPHRRPAPSRRPRGRRSSGARQASVVRESRRPHTAARTLPAMETVILERRGGELRITLNRPDTMNAWDKQLGIDLLAAVREAADDDAVRAVTVTGAGRAFSSGADLRAGFDPTPEGHPDVLTVLHERYHPIIRRPARAAQAGAGRRQRPGGRDRLLARARRRPDRGARVRLLPARVREHRSGSGRRLVAAGAGADRARARERDGDARRADPRAAGARMGPDQPGRARRRVRRRGRRARGAAGGRADRRLRRDQAAAQRLAVRAAWTSSSSSRRRSSSGRRRRATSKRACRRSSRSGRPHSRAGERPASRPPVHILPTPWLQSRPRPGAAYAGW